MPGHSGDESAPSLHRVCTGRALPVGGRGLLCCTRVQENQRDPSSRLLWLLPRASPGHTAGVRPRKAWRGELCLSRPWDLPGSEASRLGPRGQVQSFPRLGRFLSVHLLQD